MKPNKREELILEMLNKQLAFVGKTVEDVKDEPEWFSNYSITEEQFKEWETFCMKILEKKFRMTKARAKYEFAFMNLNWGLKVISEEKKPE